MSATPEEFFRSLAHFAPETAFDKTAKRFDFPLNNGRAEVSIEVMPARRVTGLLSLPQLAVSIAFQDASPADQDRFMDDFDLAFRRGGG